MFWDSDDYCTLCGGHGHLAKDCHLTKRDVGTIVGSILYVVAGMGACALAFLGAGERPIAAALFLLVGILLFLALGLQYGATYHPQNLSNWEIDSYEAGFAAGYDQALSDTSREQEK